MKTKRKYFIGESTNYSGKFVAVKEQKEEISKKVFYKILESSLIQNKLQKYSEEAKLIQNLKLGVSLGRDFFLIKDIRIK